jgi:hypothetical protein
MKAISPNKIQSINVLKYAYADMDYFFMLFYIYYCLSIINYSLAVIKYCNA